MDKSCSVVPEGYVLVPLKYLQQISICPVCTDCSVSDPLPHPPSDAINPEDITLKDYGLQIHGVNDEGRITDPELFRRSLHAPEILTPLTTIYISREEKSRKRPLHEFSANERNVKKVCWNEWS